MITINEKPVFDEQYDLLRRPSQQKGGFAHIRKLKELVVGSGDNSFHADKQGIWLGNKNFADAIFSVKMDGDINIGDYDNGEGTKWDQSAAKLLIKGDIIVGSLTFNKQFIYTSFESADGWGHGADLTPLLGGANMQTGGTINTKRYINDEITGGQGVFATKNPFFQAGVEFSSNTDQEIYFGCGDLHLGDGTEEGLGFKITNGTLYALHTKSDGATATEYTTEITGITIRDTNHYKAVYDYDASKIYFYVNGTLRATHTTNLPTLNNYPILMSFSIENTIAANKAIFLKYALFGQDF